MNKPYHNSVNDMVQYDLKWERLQTKMAHVRLGMLYKIVEGLVVVPTPGHPVPRPEHHTNCRNSKQFNTVDPKVDIYKFAFLPRAVVWNTLPDNVVFDESWRRFVADSSRQDWEDHNRSQYTEERKEKT